MEKFRLGSQSAPQIISGGNESERLRGQNSRIAKNSVSEMAGGIC
jgi:hypothetical protein